MERSGRIVWLTGIAIAVLMVVFPPWLYYDGLNSDQSSAGYHFLLSRPPLKTYEVMFGYVPDDKMPTQYARVSLNGLRLIAQLLTLVFLTAGIGLKRRGGFPVSRGPFFLGICGVGLLILMILSKKL